MSTWVYPRLPTSLATAMLPRLKAAHESGGISAVRELSELSHPKASPVPTGGRVASLGQLASVREAVRDRMAPWFDAGQVPSSEVSRFDAAVGDVLHERLEIVPADAAHVETWNFLTLVMLPDVAVLRFPQMHPNRMLGTDRNALRRTWIRRAVLGPLMAPASRPLGEDELVGMFERSALARNRELLRQLAQRVLAYDGEESRSQWARELYKRVTFATGPRLLDCLEPDELAALIEGAEHLPSADRDPTTQDDDEFDVETSVRGPSRRDVARHILECFERSGVGVELTVGEIASAPSSQYDAGEISPGAVRARLEAGTVPGVTIVADRSPMTARLDAGWDRTVQPGPPVAPSGDPSPAVRATGARNQYRPAGRRDVGQHIQEVFANLPPGTVLSVGQIAAAGSSQYGPGEISQGAIHALLERKAPLPGLEEVPGVRPRSVRRRGPLSVSHSASSAGDSPSTGLAREFHREMVSLYQRCVREVNYHPTVFIRMISQHGGVETARRLVTSPNPSDGFATLWEAGRLDLTAEALVVLPRYAALFGDDVVARARERLAEYGFGT